MAHKKAGGSTSLGRDSVSKRLGVKIFGDQRVGKGEIIVRQHGNKFHAGLVKFQDKMMMKFHGNLRKTRVVSVIPLAKDQPKPSSALLKASQAAGAKTEVKETVKA